MRAGKLLPLTLVLACTAAATARAQGLGPPAGQQVPPPPPGALPPEVPAPPDLDPLPQPLAEPSCERIWFSADYLLWWNKDNHLPPMLTTGSVNDTHPGALGQSGTQVLYGGAIDSEERSGGRFNAGWWFSREHCFGVDAGFFFLGSRTTSFSTDSQAVPLLTIPFFEANTGQALAFRLASPGGNAATYSADVSNRFWGAEMNLRAALHLEDFLQWSLLAGFRYLDLSEALNTNTAVLGGPLSQGGQTPLIQTAQTFGTRNYFYGGQVGSELTSVFGQMSVSLSGKVALGATHEIAVISGGSAVGGQAGVPITELVYPSNAGRYSRDMFTVVPEVGITFGYDVTSHVRLTFGYTFLYMSNAIRPGDLIDTTVNLLQARAALGLGQASGPVRPVFPGNATDFWAQGVSAGIEFRY
jgi:hypothetical protein